MTNGLKIGKILIMRTFYIYLIILISSIIAGCAQIEEKGIHVASESLVTKSYGDKYPIMSVYIETNDVNPLNAGDYMLDDGTAFFDVAELLSANIHKNFVGNQEQPTLYFNEKLTDILLNGGVDKYIRPLQDKGIKVLLTVFGDGWQNIGLTNMNSTQTTQFAEILAYVVEKYGLDGIGFIDEHAGYMDYEKIITNSFSEIITKLHALMPSDKLITVFDWGYTNTINSAAAACIDYAYHGYFGSYYMYSSITGMSATPERWSASSFNLGNSNSASTASNYASRTLNDGYGAMMFFTLRTRNDNNPLSLFNAIAGELWGMSVSCDNGNRSRDIGSVPSGYTITYDMVK